MKVALYARYSSDSQRDASIADQLRICRAHADRQGWRIIEEYTDHAVSGASLLRPGIQALIADALKGRFQVVLAEAMDRLSRDQEDIAGLFKRMAFAGIKIITLSEGEVTHLHVGLKGTMNALFLKDLADKTHRGLRGRIEQGKSGGGNAYGYDIVKQFQANGEPLRGDRTINKAEADIVRRIYRDYAAGKSPKHIALELNNEGIKAPGSEAWGFSTILGSRKRGTGILNNELYIGRLIWNRQHFVRDPDSGKRRARPNPEADWIIRDVPELRIIDEALWQAVKARQATVRDQGIDLTTGEETATSLRDRRRPKYLLSGLTRCGCCGGGYSMISAVLVGCSTARNKGTCDNRLNIRRDRLEARVLDALRYHLMDPALFKEFCDEFTREMNRLRMEGRASIEAAQAELHRIDKQISATVDAIADGMYHPSMKEKMDRLESRKTALQQFLTEAVEPPPLLHPEMAQFYRQQVSELHAALRDEIDATRLQAGEILRSLIKEIVLTPEDGVLQIDVRGDLAGILTIAVGGKAVGATKQKGRPFGAASVSDVVSQLE
ncbi:recombinase family protein, partial [Niveispirillum sp. KHB5.9]|uniref:recombinase family protein n=1 Tax=Niveispirillum sp. KHB5.9 TaxID=3400269 RepID=UPI003A841C44